MADLPRTTTPADVAQNTAGGGDTQHDRSHSGEKTRKTGQDKQQDEVQGGGGSQGGGGPQKNR